MSDFRLKARFSNVTVYKETERAIICDFPDLGVTKVIPKSQIDDDSEVWKDGDFGELVISEWIAEQKGLL